MEIPSYGQDLRNTVEFADQEFSNGRYQNAVKEYLRAFIFSNDSLQPILARRIGKCFVALNDLDRAEHFYFLAYRLFTNDSIKLECTFERLSTQIRQSKYYSTIDELGKLPDTLPQYFTRRKHFYLGICHWGIQEYEKAFSFFQRFIPENDIWKQQNLLLLQQSFFKPQHPYYQLAAILSVIPGLGQFYSGDLASGLESFILCGSLIIIGVCSVQLLQTGVVLLNIIPWFERYYIGNIKNAKAAALRIINEKKNKTFLDILKLLSE